MTKNIKNIFNTASAIVFGSFILWSCESEADNLGSQFFDGADVIDETFDLIAYNINNGDTIRSDAKKLDSAAIGAFSETQFGMQKVDYVTQLRLSAYAPDFGKNPVLDSAILVLKPAFKTDSAATTTDEDYEYFKENDTTAIPAKKEVSIYPIRKYGNTMINGNKTVMNIRVQEVTDFLGAATDSIKSNKNVAVSTLLGTKEFKGDVTSVNITQDSDNSVLFSIAAGIRIPLDSAFFQNKIIDKAKSTELSDMATFIRYFRGIKISVDENDGYLFKINPNSTELILYYKSKPTDTADMRQATFNFALGAGNTHFSQIRYDRTGTPAETALSTINSTTGDAKLFVQGMGGPAAGFRFPETAIQNLRDKYKNEKVGIIGARIRVYTDSDSWTQDFAKPNYFNVRQKNLYTFLNDMNTLAAGGKYALVRTYNLSENPAYYDISITQTLKDIVEAVDFDINKVKEKDIIINVGAYTIDATTGVLAGYSSKDYQQNYNTRSYTPNRVVLIGTRNQGDPLYEKSAKLLITYGKK
ncbi:MAG: DUF4270 domain-containing protein [Flavobacteriaceae bacterium]|jgi:hypothetical protein|nr:DUF4270 domain-containing protein [Flavobacteriaceae bacterium]